MRAELRQKPKKNESCLLCREPLREATVLVRCGLCAVGYHWECVDELGRGGCMTLACQGTLSPVSPSAVPGESQPPPSATDLMVDRARERFASRGRASTPDLDPPPRADPLQIQVRPRPRQSPPDLAGELPERPAAETERLRNLPPRRSRPGPPPSGPYYLVGAILLALLVTPVLVALQLFLSAAASVVLALGLFAVGAKRLRGT